jgi:hypothetical protein
MTVDFTFRLVVAVIYGAVIVADCYFELSGRYARAGVPTPRLPYLESSQTFSALALLALNVLLIAWALGDPWRWPPIFAMLGYSILVAKRIWKARHAQRK